MSKLVTSRSDTFFRSEAAVPGVPCSAVVVVDTALTDLSESRVMYPAIPMFSAADVVPKDCEVPAVVTAPLPSPTCLVTVTVPALAEPVVPIAMLLPVALVNTMPEPSDFSEATTPVFDDCSLIAATDADNAEAPEVAVSENEMVTGVSFSDCNWIL